VSQGGCSENRMKENCKLGPGAESQFSEEEADVTCRHSKRKKVFSATKKKTKDICQELEQHSGARGRRGRSAFKGRRQKKGVSLGYGGDHQRKTVGESILGPFEGGEFLIDPTKQGTGKKQNAVTAASLDRKGPQVVGAKK